MIKDAVKFDPEEKKMKVSFPIVGDIEKFKDNRRQAIQRAESLRKPLIKRNLYDKYMEVIKDFVNFQKKSFIEEPGQK